jgi:hypothetical protein
LGETHEIDGHYYLSTAFKVTHTSQNNHTQPLLCFFAECDLYFLQLASLTCLNISLALYNIMDSEITEVDDTQADPEEAIWTLRGIVPEDETRTKDYKESFFSTLLTLGDEEVTERLKSLDERHEREN